MDRLRGVRGVRREVVRIGVADPTLTPVSGMAAITELVECPGLIEFLDGAVGPIKRQNRGFGAGELLVGMASAQLAGEDFLAGMDAGHGVRAGKAMIAKNARVEQPRS